MGCASFVGAQEHQSIPCLTSNSFFCRCLFSPSRSHLMAPQTCPVTYTQREGSGRWIMQGWSYCHQWPLSFIDTAFFISHPLSTQNTHTRFYCSNKKSRFQGGWCFHILFFLSPHFLLFARSSPLIPLYIPLLTDER